MTEQRATPEMRTALRAQYGGVPPRSCERCGHRTISEHATERGVWWRCRWCDNCGIADFDVRIVALLDDADALAGALAEVGRLRAALAEAADALARYEDEHAKGSACFRDVLLRLQRALTHTALAPQSSTPTEKGPSDE